MNESRWRSIVKAYSWRFCGSCITFCISYMVTRRVIISGTISGTELLIKPFFYWCHERGWNKVKWGINNNKNFHINTDEVKN